MNTHDVARPSVQATRCSSVTQSELRKRVRECLATLLTDCPQLHPFGARVAHKSGDRVRPEDNFALKSLSTRFLVFPQHG